MPIRKGRGVAVMITFRAEDLARVDAWADHRELPRAVAIRAVVLREVGRHERTQEGDDGEAPPA